MTQSWKPLPDDLSAPARRLAEELRAVKDAHGISLAELGKRTYLSKASWERWLNGKRLITPQALAGLTAALDCDAVLLTSLLREAEAARDAAEPPAVAPAAPVTDTAPAAVPVTDAGTAPAATVPVPAPVPVPVPVSVPGPVPVALSAADRIAAWRRPPALFAVAAVAVLVLLASLYLHGLNGDKAAATPPAAAGPTPLCQAIGCAGKDPQAMGCEDDDHTLLTGNVGKVIIYVHYSPRCRAAWAGITDGAPGDTVTITNNAGWQESALIHWGYDNYSKMVDASASDATLRVCGHQEAGDGCTGLVTNPAARASTKPTPAPNAPNATSPATTPSS